jgi:regulator of replication initiation timing
LRHALVIKAQNDQCQEVVKGCRDSISLLNKLVISQDELIRIKTEKIALLEENQRLYIETIKNKDAIVETYKKKYQKEKKKFGSNNESASKYLQAGEYVKTQNINPTETAALMQVNHMLFNLDETTIK